MGSPEPDRSAPPREGEAARYTSLADYVRVVRRHRVLIAAITIGFAIAAFAFSKTRPTTYEAEAQMSFGDPFAALSLVSGRSATPSETAMVRATNAADLVTSPSVERKVARELRKNPPAGCSIDASVLVDTNNVAVDGTCRTAAGAARYANAYATAARELGNAQARAEIGRFARALAKRIDEAKKHPIPGVTEAQLAGLQADYARVQTLKEAATPVEIVERATPPDTTASPRPIRDAIIGLLVGLVVGLLVAFGRDALDRRLRSSHEVHDELGLPVLGRVSRTALGHAGLARNGMAPMRDEDFEAFRVLRMNLAYLADGGPVKSVLVTSGLPEEGKSTVSAALASAAVLAGQRTLLVECDLRRPCFARRFAVESEPGLTDYLLGNASPQEILQTVELGEPVRVNGSTGGEGRPAGTLVCITGGTLVSNPAELLVSERFRDFLDKVSKAYDLVVLDGAPLLAVADPLEILPHVDAGIMCVRVQQTTRDEVRAARAALSTLPRRPMGAVLTGMRRGDPDAYDYYGY
jgi:tyrosine-protein kinase